MEFSLTTWGSLGSDIERHRFYDRFYDRFCNRAASRGHVRPLQLTDRVTLPAIGCLRDFLADQRDLVIA